MVKDERVFIRVSAADKEKLQEDAKRLGLSVSAYLIMLWKKDQEERYSNLLKEVDELQDTNSIFL